MSGERKIKKRFHTEGKDLSDIMLFVHDFLESSFASEKTKKKIELAIEEMAINIIHYAYDKKKGPIEIELLQEDPARIQIEIVDWGEKFDPTQNNPKLVDSEEVNKVEEGGLGIYLASKVMDEIHYQRVGTENHLRMFKRL